MGFTSPRLPDGAAARGVCDARLDLDRRVPAFMHHRPVSPPRDNRPLEVPADALVLLAGAAGSGKSSLAARLFPADSILSSDAIRRQLTGDEANQAVNRRAFQVLHARAGRRLAEGRLTVIDATNVHASARRPLRRMAAVHGRPVVVLVLDLPADVCHARNAARRAGWCPSRPSGASSPPSVARSTGSSSSGRVTTCLVVLASPEAVDRLSVRLTAPGGSDTLSANGGVPATHPHQKQPDPKQPDRSRSRTP